MAIEIVTDQDQLAMPCAKVEDFEKSLPRILEALNWVENDSNKALGLAAPQIGVQERWFVMKNTHATWTEHKVIVVINPTMKAHGKVSKKVEYCFSAPGQAFEVSRRSMVDAKFITLANREGQFKKVSVSFAGQPAQVFQHEFDHIRGMCIFHKGTKIG